MVAGQGECLAVSKIEWTWRNVQTVHCDCMQVTKIQPSLHCISRAWIKNMPVLPGCLGERADTS